MLLTLFIVKVLLAALEPFKPNSRFPPLFVTVIAVVALTASYNKRSSVAVYQPHLSAPDDLDLTKSPPTELEVITALLMIK